MLVEPRCCSIAIEVKVGFLSFKKSSKCAPARLYTIARRKQHARAGYGLLLLLHTTRCKACASMAVKAARRTTVASLSLVSALAQNQD